MTESKPDWLNAEFFKKALRFNRKDENLEIMSCKVDRATQPGDNFASEMYRAALEVKANGEKEDVSLIIKCRLRGGELTQTPVTFESFVREAKVFSEINSQILKEASIKNNQPFGAKCFYSTTEPWYEAIVLEDLKKEGFQLATVDLGLDLKHCMLVIRSIAQYHASSMVLYSKDKTCFEPFKESLFVKYPDSGMGQFLATSIKNIVEEITNWPGYEMYADMLKSLIPKSMDHWMDAIRKDETGFNVFIHGDLWLNNIMFRYSQESGEVQDIRFVDFQLSCTSSPAVDLHYFLNTSALPELLENNLDELIQEYHSSLCQTLSELDHETLQPTLDAIKSEFQKRGLFGALSGFSVRGVALSDRNHIPDFEDIIGNNGNIYLSEAYKNVLRKLLPLYSKLGWLNH
ncbi:hypothetical protein L9F63_023769 [Diploptera punctata]|uniref:CHK kinase-like domain-containing protein n=1 Tax=Diploptera punctata TaxID=6984 RepID=A0AAD7ZI04_DIPPU|nr:hypothetical protein L9F63_023769 [Diploptera punctata]